MITVYRELQARRWHAEDLQPLCAKLGEENTGKTLVAVTALEQVGLIAAVERGELDEREIDAHVYRVLREKQALGLID